jgi:hypothetical protein
MLQDNRTKRQKKHPPDAGKVQDPCLKNIDDICCRVARFFLGTTYQNGNKIYQITKNYIKWQHLIPQSGKMYQMAAKYTKWPQNIPISGKKTIGHIIHIPTSFIARPSQIYPNRDFWFENMPSGNPALLL